MTILERIKSWIPKNVNPLPKLVEFLPAYKGYAEREKRRDEDKKIRSACAERLIRLDGDTGNAVAKLLKFKKMDELSELDQLKTRLRGTADRIRYADYGYSSMFDVSDQDSDILQKVICHDLVLVELCLHLENLVRGQETISPHDLAEGIRALEEHMIQRKLILEG